MNLSKSALAVVLLAGVAGSSVLNASTNGFYVPTIRSTPGAQAGLWESFTVAIGSPGNFANIGNDTASVLTQTQPGAQVLGSGNIYNMPNASAFTVNYAGAGQVGQVVFQARTAGTELNYGTVQISYAGGSLTAPRTETDRFTFPVPEGQPGSGAAVSSAWQWDLTSFNVSSYTISFSAAEPSLSFDSATLDTQVVPEPQTWALFGVGAGALAFVGWRQRRISA